MTIEVFLKELQECLEEQISSEEMNDALIYYRSYYYEQLNLGKSKEEIFQTLGSPRLIARSIIDAREDAPNKAVSGYYDVEDDTYQEEGRVPVEQKMKALIEKGGIILGLICIVIAVGALLSYLLPVILLLLIIYGFFKLSR